MSARPQRLAVPFVLSALVAAAATRAEANVGARSRGGSLAGEPEGVGAIVIAREDLVIDLRPLAEEDGLVAVTATYHLDNPADEQHLDLVFAMGSGGADFRVALDGRHVPSAFTSGAKLPESWRPPASTPLFGGDELSYEPRGGAAPASFRLDVPPGRHALTISYQASATWYHHGDPTILRQLAYVLSPARTWGGFGGLDVTVHVPPGWRAAVTPALRREGDTLKATFPTVPADALAITVQAPPGAHALVRYATGALFALVLIGGGVVVVRRTRARERRRPDAISASGAAAFGRALLWGVAVLLAGLLAVLGPDLTLPHDQADHRGYGDALALVGVVMLSVAVLVVGTLISLAAGRRVHAER